MMACRCADSDLSRQRTVSIRALRQMVRAAWSVL